MVGLIDSRAGPSFIHENILMERYGAPIAGIDEAGRGPWAGPVVAAAVILDARCIPAGLNDSKKLSASARETLFTAIMAQAHVGVGIADIARIDQDNILQATLWAMGQACIALPKTPAAALIDGNRSPSLPCPTETLVKGDALSLCVAAASIIAKVTRDRIMVELAISHPGYAWERNKGYGTRDHADGLQRHGVTPHHRRSFKPIQTILSQKAGED